jgi:hypothetical protein
LEYAYYNKNAVAYKECPLCSVRGLLTNIEYFQPILHDFETRAVVYDGVSCGKLEKYRFTIQIAFSLRNDRVPPLYTSNENERS